MVTLSRGLLTKPTALSYLINQYGEELYPSTYTGSFANVGYYKQFSGERKTRFRPGIVSIHPVTIRTTQGSCTSMDIRMATLYQGTRRYVEVGELAGLFVNPAALLPAWNDNLANLVTIKAAARLNEPGAEIGVMLGELVETVTMIKHPLSGLRKGLMKMRRSMNKAKKSKNAVEAINGTFLEYIYGYAPLANDVDNLIQHYYTRGADTLLNLRRKSAHYDSEKTTVVKTQRSLTNFKWNELYSYTIKQSYTCGQYYHFIENANERSRLSYWGVSPSQTLDVLWALTPYSFVVDWFTDVGSWLKAVQPAHNVGKKGGYVSYKADITATSSLVPRIYSTLDLQDCIVSGNSVFTWSLQSLERRFANAVGIPAYNPAWLNVGHATAGAALIVQNSLNLLRL